jgi:hypothetical protein
VSLTYLITLHISVIKFDCGVSSLYIIGIIKNTLSNEYSTGLMLPRWVVEGWGRVVLGGKSSLHRQKIWG